MRILSVLMLTAILGFATAILVSSPVEAGANCFCFFGGTTSDGYGMGPTCADAQNNLIDTLTPEIDCGIDGDCGYTVVYTNACLAAKNGFVSSGRLRYDCRICF